MDALSPRSCVGRNALPGVVGLRHHKYLFSGRRGQKAADRIIDEVWQIRKDAAAPASGQASGEEKK